MNQTLDQPLLSASELAKRLMKIYLVLGVFEDDDEPCQIEKVECLTAQPDKVQSSER